MFPGNSVNSSLSEGKFIRHITNATKKRCGQDSSKECLLLYPFLENFKCEAVLNWQRIYGRDGDLGFLSGDKRSRSQTLSALDIHVRVASRNRCAKLCTVAPCGNIILDVSREERLSPSRKDVFAITKFVCRKLSGCECNCEATIMIKCKFTRETHERRQHDEIFLLTVKLNSFKLKL